MKMTYINLRQLEPKNNASAKQNKANEKTITPEQQQAIDALNAKQDGKEKTTDTPAQPAPAPLNVIKSPTAQEAFDAANAKLSECQAAVKAARLDETKTDDEIMELSLSVFNAKKAVVIAEEAMKREGERQRAIIARNAKVQKIDDLLGAYLAKYIWDKENPAPAIFAEDGITTTEEHKAWLVASNAAGELYNTLRPIIDDIVAGKPPVTNNGTTRANTVSTGTTGTSAPRGEKSKEILKIWVTERLAGKTDTEARKTALDAGYNDGTIGNVVKPHKDKSGDELAALIA